MRPLIAILISLTLSGATRLYFPATATPVVTPAVQTGWSDSSEKETRLLSSFKGASTVGAGQTVDILEDQASYDDLDRQYVSIRLAAGAVFTSGVTTVKAVIQMRELANTDDVNQCIMGIRVMDEAGTTLQATLLAVANYGPTAEMLHTGFRNKQCADGDTVTASYTTVFGDRLVVEIGYMTDGAETTPQAAANWGENATDCAENETDTTSCAGWIEFSNAITFAGENGGKRTTIIVQ